jgi:hypothetical protein
VKRILFTAISMLSATVHVQAAEMSSKEKLNAEFAQLIFVVGVDSQFGPNHVQRIEELIQEGANLETRGYFDTTMLMMASKRGKADLVNKLLEKGANINAIARQQTALMWAIMSDQISIARLLLDKGANIHLRNGKGQTAGDLLEERIKKYEDRLKAGPSKIDSERLALARELLKNIRLSETVIAMDLPKRAVEAHLKRMGTEDITGEAAVDINENISQYL